MNRSPGREARVLVVDDSLAVRSFLQHGLDEAGLEVALAEDGDIAINLVADWPPDVIVLDLSMPRVNGFTVLERLREWCDAPVIIISADAEDERKVRAFRGGADEFLSKPFTLRQLLDRIRAIQRLRDSRADAEAIPTIRRGDLTIHPERRRVFQGGREVTLTRSEFDLLLALAEAGGSPVSHSRLCRIVWGRFDEDAVRGLRTFVKQLRQKLGDTDVNARYVVTVRGSGYQLIGEAG